MDLNEAIEVGLAVKHGNKMKACPGCGYPIRADAVLCPKCGWSADQEEES